MTPERRWTLDERVPGWDVVVDSFTEALISYVSWLAEHDGRKPSGYSLDPVERRHSKWMSNRRFGDWMTAERRQTLDERIPGWDDVVDSFAEALDSYVSWLADHDGRKPAGKSQDPEERKLSKWMQHQRSGDGMTPERRWTLDERVPGWDDAIRPSQPVK